MSLGKRSRKRGGTGNPASIIGEGTCFNLTKKNALERTPRTALANRKREGGEKTGTRLCKGSSQWRRGEKQREKKTTTEEEKEVYGKRSPR